MSLGSGAGVPVGRPSTVEDLRGRVTVRQGTGASHRVGKYDMFRE